MFTDTEVALKIGYDRTIRAYERGARAIVDRKDSEIAMLTAALQDARAELAQERAKRIAAELRIEEILDTPI
jgi:hypothetical protein